MKDREEISVLIVTHNPERATLTDCLRSVAASSVWPKEVWLADNSEVKSPVVESLVKPSSPYPMRAVFNERNLGYAQAVNRLIRLAEANYLLILNDDVTLHPMALESLVSTLKASKQIAVVAARVNYKDPADKIWSAGGRIYPWLGYCQEIKEPSQNLRKVDWASGCVLMINRTSLGDDVYWDEKYFLYFEDVDFCQRVQKAGYSVAVNPKALAWHSRQDLDAVSPAWRLKFLYFSKFRFFWKNFPWYQALSATIFQLTTVSIYDFIFWRQGPLLKFRIFVDFLLTTLKEGKRD